VSQFLLSVYFISSAINKCLENKAFCHKRRTTSKVGYELDTAAS
jgi:hypothetical protein